MLKFTLGYAFSLLDLFKFWKNKRLSFSSIEYEKTHCDRHREDLVMKIFKESVKIVVDDIIENNVTFVMPMRDISYEIFVKSFTGDEFIERRKRGLFREVDFLKSNFTGNQLCFRIRRKNNVKDKPIYIDKKFKAKLTEYTNQGKQYC